jgi:hypothetical protein
MPVAVQHINIPAFFALNADWGRIERAGAVPRLAPIA